MKDKVIVVCGPTATGKTALAAELAKRLSSEVISADSMCVYRGFDIGTAKPTEAETKSVKHHLIDVVNGNESFSVADYKRLAQPVLKELIDRGKTA